jgi:molybdenum cofactor cytidylyltransferase
VNEKVYGIVPAAGASTRMGQSKMLLPLGKDCVLGQLLRSAVRSELYRVILVLGYEGQRIRGELKDILVHPKIATITNRAYWRGMSTSLKAGIRALGADARGAMILLGDQPMVRSEMINRLIGVFSQHRDGIVTAGAGTQRFHPVLFPRELFPELLKISGDEGGRKVLLNHPQKVKKVSFPPGLWCLDLDTPQSYRKLLRKVKEEAS